MNNWYLVSFFSTMGVDGVAFAGLGVAGVGGMGGMGAGRVRAKVKKTKRKVNINLFINLIWKISFDHRSYLITEGNKIKIANYSTLK